MNTTNSSPTYDAPATRPRRIGLAVFLLVAAFVVLCAHGLVWDSPTVDEFAHLPSGYWTLVTGRFELFPLNPPLVKVLSALPLLALDPVLDTTGPVRNTGWFPWQFGTDFMEQNRAIYLQVFTLGRLVPIALGAVLGLLVFWWGRALYGDEAGLVGLLFFAFCPSIIAHAHLATVDVGFALFATLALWTFWRFVHAPSWRRGLTCAVALGLVQLAKMSALLLYPIFGLLALIALARGERFSFGRSGARGSVLGSVGAVALIFAASVVVLDVGYLCTGVGRAVGSYHFESSLLRGFATLAPWWLPMPVPESYLEGLDALQLINDFGEFPTFFMGERSPEGAASYYLATVLLKTPLPLLLALLLAPWVRRLPDVRGEEFLWLPALALLGWFSFFSSVHYGIRYVLPILPLLMIWSARVVPRLLRAPRLLAALAAAPVVFYPASVLLATPDTIDYFNVAAGGEGERFLLDSNVDWGQGLPRVAAFMKHQELETIALAYFGHVDPALYGITWTFPRPGDRGLVAVSANFLAGSPYATYANGRMVPVGPDGFSWIRDCPRVARLGGGIFIHDLDGCPSPAPG